MPSVSSCLSPSTGATSSPSNSPATNGEKDLDSGTGSASDATMTDKPFMAKHGHQPLVASYPQSSKPASKLATHSQMHSIQASSELKAEQFDQKAESQIDKKTDMLIDSLAGPSASNDDFFLDNKIGMPGLDNNCELNIDNLGSVDDFGLSGELGLDQDPFSLD